MRHFQRLLASTRFHLAAFVGFVLLALNIGTPAEAFTTGDQIPQRGYSAHELRTVSLSSMNAVTSSGNPTHCKAEEKVVFSCTFPNKKTVSLCASVDLTKDTGTLQYRYGLLGGGVELRYPITATDEGKKYLHPSWKFKVSGPRSYDPRKSRVSVMFTPFEEEPNTYFSIEVRRYIKTAELEYAYLDVVRNKQHQVHHSCLKNTVIDHFSSFLDIIQKK